jgi:hypothetical protein
LFVDGCGIVQGVRWDLREGPYNNYKIAFDPAKNPSKTRT